MSRVNIKTTTDSKIARLVSKMPQIQQYTNSENYLHSFTVGFRSGKNSNISIDPINTNVYNIIKDMLLYYKSKYNLDEINNFNQYWDMLFDDNSILSTYAASINTLASNVIGTDIDSTKNYLFNMIRETSVISNSSGKRSDDNETILKSKKLNLDVSDKGRSIIRGKNKVMVSSIRVTGQVVDILDNIFDYVNEYLKEVKIANGNLNLFVFCVYHKIFKQAYTYIAENNDNTFRPLMYDQSIIINMFDTLIRRLIVEKIDQNGNSEVIVFKSSSFPNQLQEKYKTAVIYGIYINKQHMNTIGNYLNSILSNIAADETIKLLTNLDTLAGDLVTLINNDDQCALQFYNNINMYVDSGYVFYQCNQIPKAILSYFRKLGVDEQVYIRKVKAENNNVMTSDICSKISKKEYMRTNIDDNGDPFNDIKAYALIVLSMKATLDTYNINISGEVDQMADTILGGGIGEINDENDEDDEDVNNNHPVFY